MPELCRFYNIVIKMLYSDDAQHHRPHFHVYTANTRRLSVWMGSCWPGASR